MFFRRESHSVANYEKATEKQKEVSKNLADTVREIGQFPDEKEDKKHLKQAHGMYDAANAKLQELLKSGQKKANKYNEQYEALRTKHENAERVYQAAKETYEALTKELEQFERGTLGMSNHQTLEEENIAN